MQTKNCCNLTVLNLSILDISLILCSFSFVLTKLWLLLVSVPRNALVSNTGVPYDRDTNT